MQIKYQIKPCLVSPKFLRLRPSNFPTIRLSQLANLLHHQKQIFSKILSCKSPQNCYNILKTSASSILARKHYHFGKKSARKRRRSISDNFMDLLIINIIIPLRCLYYSRIGNETAKIQSLDIARKIKPEKNNIIHTLADLNVKVCNAMDSQALIHLHSLYCVNRQCASCAVFKNIYK